MVMTVGTTEQVMETQPLQIGPVKVVSNSRQEGRICSISYWPGSRFVMTRGSSISVQLPTRRVKNSPQGKLGPVMRMRSVRGVQLWLPQGSRRMLWITSVGPLSLPTQQNCVGLHSSG